MRARPLKGAGLALLAGGAVALATAAAAAGANFVLPAWGLAVIWGAAAAAAARLLGLERWWRPLVGLLPVCVWFGLQWTLPGWVIPALLLLTLSVYWNAVREGVPLYLSNRATWNALAGLLPAEPGVRFVDLGSGLGGVVLALAKARPDGHFVGVETAPLSYALSRVRLAASGLENAEIRFRSLWSEALGSYDVVYCFLSPVPMARLYGKAAREMRPGAVLISNTFEVPDQTPDRTHVLDDGRRTALHVFEMGAKGLENQIQENQTNVAPG